MHNTLRYLIGGVAGVVIGAALLFLLGLGRGSVGGSTNYGGDLVVDGFTAASTTVGTLGTSKTFEGFTTCTPSFSSADLAASTTAVGICTDARVAVGDKILVTTRFSGASTGLPSMGLFPSIAVIASTTGAFGIQSTNFTGAATTSINSIYRTYSYLIIR